MSTKTPHFTENQLIYIAALVKTACKDRLTSIEWEDEVKQVEYEAGAVDTAGLILASLFADITGGGMAIADAVDLAQLDDKSTNSDARKAAANFLIAFEK